MMVIIREQPRSLLETYSKSSSHLTFVQIKTNLPAEEDEDAAHVSVASGGSPATKNL